MRSRRHLRKVYPARKDAAAVSALDGVSLSIEEGAVMV